MDRSYLLGIDIGTFESKGCIASTDGSVVATAAVPHGMENPKPNYYEHDAEEVWWGDLCKLTKELIEKSGVRPEEIGAVGVSTLGTCCLPVDKEIKPLRRAILYGIDARSVDQIAFLTKHYGEDKVRELFGRPIISGDVCAKILWIKENEPDVYAKTYKFLTGTSFLVARLTGEFVIDRFLCGASFRPMYKSDGTPNEEMCSLYCRPDQLPIGRPVMNRAGTVTKEASAATGLAEGTPVIVGSGDSASEAISVGVVERGDTMIQLGSSMFMYCLTDSMIKDDRVRGNEFIIPGSFSITAGTNNCGTTTRWFRDNLFSDELEHERASGANAYETMMKEAERAPVGCDGLVTLPYLAGERTPINDPLASGAVIGLRLDHTKAHLYRSALEGIAFTIAQHVDILKELGAAPLRLIASGGGTKNDLLMQMIADASGEPIAQTEVSFGAAYGDALMAGITSGAFNDFAEIKKVIKHQKTFKPDPDNAKIYKKNRAIFDAAYPALRDMMHDLRK